MAPEAVAELYESYKDQFPTIGEDSCETQLPSFSQRSTNIRAPFRWKKYQSPVKRAYKDRQYKPEFSTFN